MECCALIPARGDSKGIPRKNVCLVAGKPLIGYTIEQACRTESIQRVVVSTDDAEIAAVAEQYGADVIWRPAEISGETASSESALLHALDHLRDTEKYEPDLVVFLQATSPLRQPDDVQNAIDTFIHEEADSLFSACPFPGFLWRREEGRLASFNFDYENRPRRQDAPEDLMENGSIFIFKPHILRDSGNRLGGKIAAYVMRFLDSFEVDEPEDLELIEHLITHRRSGRNVPDLSAVRLLALDFDGVMTDNRVLVDQTGTEAVFCHRGDGLGLARIQDAGVEVVVVSTEENPVVSARCRKLNIECAQGQADKLSALKELAEQRGVPPSQIAYVGNDINDLDCMRWVEHPVAVADAAPEVKAAARWVTTRDGGGGAVREIVEWLLLSVPDK